jgi:hypothetical protein
MTFLACCATLVVVVVGRPDARRCDARDVDAASIAGTASAISTSTSSASTCRLRRRLSSFTFASTSPSEGVQGSDDDDDDAAADDDDDVPVSQVADEDEMAPATEGEGRRAGLIPSISL